MVAAGAAAAAILCGPSIMDYAETSGNVRKPAAEVSGRFPDFEKKYANKKIRKPAGNLPETAAAGFWRVPEVSG